MLILHLSDPLFGTHGRLVEDEPEAAGEAFARILEMELSHGERIDLVCVTGDIAETARPAEYDSAATFLAALATQLELTTRQLVLVPGGHDVSWAASREVERDQQDYGFDDGELRRRIEEVKLDRFFGFLKKLYAVPGLEAIAAPLGRHCYIRDFPDLRTSVAAVNSCEQESHRKKDHFGLVSEEQTQAVIDHWSRQAEDWVRIICVHDDPRNAASVVRQPAPQGFRSTSGRVAFRGREHLRAIAEQCRVHLVLHGHQHAAGEEVWPWRTGGSAHVLGAGKLNQRQSAMAIRLIRLDPEQQLLRVKTLHYQAGAMAEGECYESRLDEALPPRTLLKLGSLLVRRFHGFGESEIELRPGFNVVVGDNGSGKTALLDGLAVAVGAVLLGLAEKEARNIGHSEVLRTVFLRDGLPDSQPQYPTEVWCTGQFEGIELTWKRSLERERGRTTSVGAGEVRRQAAALRARTRNGETVDLPVLAYYGTGRLWKKTRRRAERPTQGQQLAGYADCLNPTSNHLLLSNWLRKHAYAEAQRGSTLPQVEAVKKAVTTCIGECTKVNYDILREQLQVELAGQLLPFDLLSDGYRNMVAMVADIAWRAAVLNPHRGTAAPREASGVVLIDEIDLHLHPKWQRHVVGDLKRTFPGIQFVATTHSPFIIQNLREGELIILDRDGPPAPYADRSPEDIAEDVMGVELPQRSERHRKMMAAAEEYYHVLEQLRDPGNPRAIDAKRRLDELSEPFLDDPAYQAFLKMERMAAEAERAQG